MAQDLISRDFLGERTYVGENLRDSPFGKLKYSEASLLLIRKKRKGLSEREEGPFHCGQKLVE